MDNDEKIPKIMLKVSKWMGIVLLAAVIILSHKEFRYISGTHMSAMLHSEEPAEFIHEIREKQK